MDRAAIQRRARDFAIDWADAESEQSDRQPFWDAFYTVFGLSRRHVAVYEEAARRTSTGGGGWIDLLQPGEMAVEHKSRGENLDAAMRQLEDYLGHLKATDMPWLLVACDFERFCWKNLETGESGEFALIDLEDNLDLFWWLAGGDTPKEAGLPEIDVNFQATELLAELHDELKASGYPDHDMREWLTRILFCLFADDTDVWERKLFETFIESRTAADGSDLGPQINYVFQILNTPVELRSPALDEHLAALSYINGDLFEQPLSVPSCSEAVRDALRRASRYNWGKVSPAIFGSLFQNVMTPAERRELGAHYTTEENILKTIRPLFLDDLESELDRAKSLPSLQKFHDQLADLTYFDPACGCGNFLVVAYREIRRLETETLRRIAERQAGRSTGKPGTKHRAGQRVTSLEFLCRVKVNQFYGIEIEEFPALIARTALYLADHLANREVSAEFGEHYVRFPIPASPNITIGNALRTDWNEVLPSHRAHYVFGNPPFIGISLRSEEQTKDLQHVWGDDYHGTLDYVTGWYRVAANYLQEDHQAFAFVSTNSIVQGEQVAPFWKPIRDAGFTIAFAHQTFAWTSEARGSAHVHVVILGICRSAAAPQPRRLFLYPGTNEEAIETNPSTLNAYLVPGPDGFVEPRSTPLATVLPPVRYGNKPTDGGNFIVTPDTLDEVEADPIARRYLRRFPGAKELLHNLDRWCLWLVDAPPEDIRSSPVLRRRVQGVREFRAKSKAASTREAASTPTLFRQIAQPKGRFLCLPQHVSELRAYYPVLSYEPDVVASNANFIADDVDGLAFAFLSSSMFVAWFKLAGGRIKSDLRFNKLLVYNTFPAPELTEERRKSIFEAAAEVLDTRARFPNSSLADLYDPDAMPPELARAHAVLDRVIDKSFAPRRRKPFDGLASRQEYLFARYLAQVSGEDLTLFDEGA